MQENTRLKPTDDEAVPQEALEHFAEHMKRFMNADITSHNMERLQQAVDDEVARMRQRFKRFPKMVVVFLEHRGFVQVLRADLEHAGIQRVIQNIIRVYPQISPVEIMVAIRRSYPKYHPDDGAVEHSRVSKLLMPTNKLIV